MASRGFYWMSATLLGGSALLAWLAVRRPADEERGAHSTASTSATADGRLLGVAAADHDSARRAADHELSDLVAQRGEQPTMIPVPPRPRADRDAPATPPLAGDREQNAASDASAAARPQVFAAVRADLERRRDALRAACWPPGSDAAATFTFHASYAADGTLVTLAVPDVSGMPGVGTCLRRHVGQEPPALGEPPGAPVEIAVPIAFSGSTTLPPRPSPGSDL